MNVGNRLTSARVTVGRGRGGGGTGMGESGQSGEKGLGSDELV